MTKKTKIQMTSDLIVPLILLAGITWFFRQYKWDMILQFKFWSGTEGWFLRKSFPWHQLYNYGNIPALLLTLGSLIVLTLSFFKPHLEKFQKLTVYFILVMIIGPGILVNSVLKQNWGRPRPREVVEFGGKYQFEKVLDYDKSSGGNSFPCGHASMGFFFFAPAIAFRNKKLKFYTLLLFAWILGLAIGYGRMVQGGHFASDVIWSGMLVYWVSYLMFYILRLDKGIYAKLKVTERFRKSKVLATISVIASVLLILIVLTATPYSRIKNYKKFSELNPDIYTEVNISLTDADVEVDFASEFLYQMNAHGFGFPGSKISNKFKSTYTDSLQFVDWVQTKKGFFSEFDQIGDLKLPIISKGIINFEIDSGNLNLTIPTTADSLVFDIMIYEGILTLNNPSGVPYQMIESQTDELTLSSGMNATKVYLIVDSESDVVIKE
ncbi:MAG: phosphatase PAP2 family protein [Candidatus Zophobacter franzmannii]|nr:phosphatase PAP2 family protein [Candidatus Zophobacter franzmannii]